MHRVRTSLRAGLVGLVALWAPACYDGFDPLDPDVLAEIARQRGDAQGLAGTGLYVGPFEPLECGCGNLIAGVQVSLCDAIDLLSGFTNRLELELIQADGTVRAQPLPMGLEGGAPMLVPTLYGPLDSEGNISAAGVLQADNIVVRGQVYGRLDGTLVDGVLEVEYQQRTVADTLGGTDQIPIDSVDCRERIGMTVSWNGPPRDPADG